MPTLTDLVFWMMLVLIYAFVYFNWENIKNRLSNFFLSKSYKKSKYVCPKCGLEDWKFPNPIKPSESMVNTISLVNNLLECKNCGYIGIFYAVDDVQKFQKNFNPKLSKKLKQKAKRQN